MKMKNKVKILTSPYLLMGVLFVFVSSCKKDQIPTLTTSPISEVSHTTAKSGGNITFDGGEQIFTYGVCWSTSPNPTISDNKTLDGLGAIDFVCSISGLAPFTTYYLRAFATNSHGTGYGNEISFTTLGSSFVDSRDGNRYKSVTIGSQVWMIENLRYLPSVMGSYAYSLTDPCYYVYGYNGSSVSDAKSTANYNTYGVLYNWPAAMNGASSSSENPSGVQGVCPKGWHLPSEMEWRDLGTNLGGLNVAGGKLKERGISHWIAPNEGATNETGFTALPGGNVQNNFYDLGYYGNWWSATEINPTRAWTPHLNYSYTNISLFSDSFNAKAYGFSVRCVKD